MRSAADFLLQIIAAGISCCVIKQLFPSTGAVGGVIKLIAGIFMTLIIVSPFTDIRIEAALDNLDDFKLDGLYAAEKGDLASKETMAQIIIERTQAYILDKAESLGADITVTLKITDDMPPVPCGVEIQGNVSPYAKQVLSGYIENELGISKEDQMWCG